MSPRYLGDTSGNFQYAIWRIPALPPRSAPRIAPRIAPPDHIPASRSRAHPFQCSAKYLRRRHPAIARGLPVRLDPARFTPPNRSPKPAQGRFRPGQWNNHKPASPPPPPAPRDRLRHRRDRDLRPGRTGCNRSSAPDKASPRDGRPLPWPPARPDAWCRAR